MNSISSASNKELIKAIRSSAGLYLGKVVVVIQANPIAIVAAIIVIAAIIIGVKCYKAYVFLQLENKKLSEKNKELADQIEKQKQQAAKDAKKMDEVVKNSKILKSRIMLGTALFFQKAQAK